ncbi:hypothetical protein LEP1GSC048_2394 [Leptospira santarosai serovar Shermani str. 1342KT]|nr:hypothetical protein LEP1GSC048_2394 [Leptospira santarosai serovar Shermani str. 1342KT]
MFAGKIWLFDLNLKSNSQLRVSVGISPNFLPESLWTSENRSFFQARIFLRVWVKTDFKKIFSGNLYERNFLFRDRS